MVVKRLRGEALRRFDRARAQIELAAFNETERSFSITRDQIEALWEAHAALRYESRKRAKEAIARCRVDCAGEPTPLLRKIVKLENE